MKLYRLFVNDDGLWLELNGPTKKALINLEGHGGPIVKAAVEEVKQILKKGEV
jgi:hypothetical protein